MIWWLILLGVGLAIFSIFLTPAGEEPVLLPISAIIVLVGLGLKGG